MKIKIESDDATAILTLIDVLTGQRSGGNCFVDHRDRTRLAPFFQVAVANVENALRDQRQRTAQRDRSRRIKEPSSRTRLKESTLG